MSASFPRSSPQIGYSISHLWQMCLITHIPCTNIFTVWVASLLTTWLKDQAVPGTLPHGSSVLVGPFKAERSSLSSTGVLLGGNLGGTDSCASSEHCPLPYSNARRVPWARFAEWTPEKRYAWVYTTRRLHTQVLLVFPNQDLRQSLLQPFKDRYI